MASVDKIKITNSFARENIKKTLGYAVKKRNGYYEDLRMIDERRGDTIDKFNKAGFVNIDHAKKNSTFGITESGDEYYKDLFGSLNYWEKRISGALERFKNRIFNKENN